MHLPHGLARSDLSFWPAGWTCPFGSFVLARRFGSPDGLARSDLSFWPARPGPAIRARGPRAAALVPARWAWHGREGKPAPGPPADARPASVNKAGVNKAGVNSAGVNSAGAPVSTPVSTPGLYTPVGTQPVCPQRPAPGRSCWSIPKQPVPRGLRVPVCRPKVCPSRSFALGQRAGDPAGQCQSSGFPLLSPSAMRRARRCPPGLRPLNLAVPAPCGPSTLRPLRCRPAPHAAVRLKVTRLRPAVFEVISAWSARSTICDTSPVAA